MLEVEFEEPSTSVCDCCGGKSTRLTRFVNQDGDAFGIYYAAFSDNHSEEGLVGIVSLGEWWNDEVPEARVAFAFRLWLDGDDYKVGITDAAESDWADVDIIGKKLSRDEALSHPWIKDVFHITDHMTSDDPAIKEFFETVH